MQVNRAVLQIFDFTSQLSVYSDHELTVTDEYVQAYLEGHVDKAFRDTGARTGQLSPAAPFRRTAESFAKGERDLVDISKDVGDAYFQYLSQSGEGVMDVIFCEVLRDHRYLVILGCQAREGYTHQLMSEDDGSLTAELQASRAILPAPSQKVNCFVAVDLEDYSVKTYEPWVEYDGERIKVLEDKILGLYTQASSREVMRAMKQVVDKVAKAHESDGVREQVAVKELVAVSAEEGESFHPVKIMEQVFSHNPQQFEAAREALSEQHLEDPVSVDVEFARKATARHTIKTDTGIEIKFPVSYMKNTDYIEIVTNPDGTLRIEVKGVTKLTNS